MSETPRCPKLAPTTPHERCRFDAGHTGQHQSKRQIWPAASPVSESEPTAILRAEDVLYLHADGSERFASGKLANLSVTERQRLAKMLVDDGAKPTVPDAPAGGEEPSDEEIKYFATLLSAYIPLPTVHTVEAAMRLAAALLRERDRQRSFAARLSEAEEIIDAIVDVVEGDPRQPLASRVRNRIESERAARLVAETRVQKLEKALREIGGKTIDGVARQAAFAALASTTESAK